jgi:hypothetical protein
LYGELIDTLLNIKFEYETIKDKILIKSKECLLDTSDIYYEAKEFFLYDSLGREIQYQEFRKDNSIYFVRNTDYKTLSRFRIYYFPNGSIERIDSMKINKYGKVTDIFTYKDRIPIKITEINYDNQGRLLYELRLLNKGSLLFKYQYNELGQEIYFGSFAEDSLYFLKTSNYLDNGLIIESEEIDFRHKTTKLDIYKYEFY